MKKPRILVLFNSAVKEIRHLCDKLSIPKYVKDEAISIYSAALDSGLYRRYEEMRPAVGAVIYAASRVKRYPIILGEIATANRTEKREVAKYYNMLVNKRIIKVKPPTPSLYVYRIGKKAGVSRKSQIVAANYLREAEQRGIFIGYTPPAVAAAALYLACEERGEKLTQEELAEVIGATDATVRNIYKSLKANLRET